MNRYGDVVLGAVKIIRTLAPKKTGNLAFNAIKYYSTGSRFVIYVDYREDGGEYSGIAPYMAATNEKWTSPKWGGKQNPNEGWWDRACKAAIDYVAEELGGKLK